MAMKILARLPFSEARSEVDAPDGILEVKPHQIVVMTSIELGLRGIVRNRLKLVIDGQRREVTLRTSGWF
jgi:hypothetical protein